MHECVNGMRVRSNLVISVISFLKLVNQPLHQQFADLWHLRIDHSDKCCIHIREIKRSLLRLHQRTSKQSATANQILFEDFGNNVLDVARRDLTRTRDAISHTHTRHTPHAQHEILAIITSIAKFSLPRGYEPRSSL
jgi:hypothetical protein